MAAVEFVEVETPNRFDVAAIQNFLVELQRKETHKIILHSGIVRIIGNIHKVYEQEDESSLYFTVFIQRKKGSNRKITFYGGDTAPIYTVPNTTSDDSIFAKLNPPLPYSLDAYLAALNNGGAGGPSVSNGNAVNYGGGSATSYNYGFTSSSVAAAAAIATNTKGGPSSGGRRKRTTRRARNRRHKASRRHHHHH